jgi:hypothetical protein
MLLEKYKKSFYSGKTVAAWNSGNERISHQLNMFRHLELRNLFKYPPSKAIRDFTLLKPWEVVNQGRFPLLDHIKHPAVDFINDYERLPEKSSIKLLQVNTLTLNSFHKILIMSKKRNEKADASCVFIKDSDAQKSRNKASIVFCVGPSVSTNNIANVIAKLHLKGPIYLNDIEVSYISLVQGYCSPRGVVRRISDVVLLMYAIMLYGTEGLDRRKIITNYFNRPRKGLYKILNALERAIRKVAKTWLTPETYYQLKNFIFGVKHFPKRKKWDFSPDHFGSKN